MAITFRRSSRLNILVVDDDVGCLASVEELLLHDGHDVVTATRGEEALELVRARRQQEEVLDRDVFELSILDYNVPDLDGLETFAALLGELPRLGGIFISGEASDDLESRVISAGGFALIPKPLDATRFRATLAAFAAR